MAGGTVGYMVIEGWGAWDAFYMTVTTVATVGFREVHPLSLRGQVFTVLLIFGGVGTAFYTATLLATIIVEGGLHRRFEQRRVARMLEQHQRPLHPLRLRPHRQHHRRGAPAAGVPFVVIERDPERVQPVIERGWLGGRSRRQPRGGPRARRAFTARAGFIAAVGTDAENVYTVLTARVMRPDLFIIARVESDDAEHKLRRAGADRVISPYHIGATHMVQTALRPAVVDFVQLATSSEHLDLSMEQVHIKDDRRSPARPSSTPAFVRSSA